MPCGAASSSVSRWVQWRTARATLDNCIYGFRPVAGINLQLVPLAAQSQTWFTQAQTPAVAGTNDNYAVNYDAETVVAGSDGIPEIELQAALSSASSTSTLIGLLIRPSADPGDTGRQTQLVTGLTATDLVDLGGLFSIGIDGELILPTTNLFDPNWLQAFLNIQGQKRIWPLGSPATGTPPGYDIANFGCAVVVNGADRHHRGCSAIGRDLATGVDGHQRARRVRRPDRESVDCQIDVDRITGSASAPPRGTPRKLPMIGMTTAFQAPKNKHEAANAAEHEFQRIKARLHEQLVESFDLSRIGRIDQQARWNEVRKMAEEATSSRKDLAGRIDLERLVNELMDEIFGLGPLEKLMQDPAITDILVNDHSTVYVERHGRLELTDVVFADDQHLLRIIQRIVAVGPAH